LIFNLTQNLPLAVGEGRKREFYFSKKERNCHNTDGEGIEKGEIIDWSPRDSGAVRRTESTMFSTFYSDQVMKFFPLHHFFPAHQKKKEKRKCIFLFFSNHIVIAMRFSDQHLPPTSVSRPSTESLERYRIYD
jgi:hypothetical protein